MNAIEMARTAYSSSATPIRTPKSVEYEAFARITARMKSASAEGRLGFPALAQAMHENRQLWTMLAADVAEPDNALPEMLRAQIFYLAEFTLQHSAKVLEGAADPGVLIEINTAVMRGLRHQDVGT